MNERPATRTPEEERRPPRTEAGKALWFDMTARSGGEALHPLWVEHLRTRIVAIEDEASRTPVIRQGKSR